MPAQWHISQHFGVHVASGACSIMQHHVALCIHPFTPVLAYHCFSTTPWSHSGPVQPAIWPFPPPRAMALLAFSAGLRSLQGANYYVAIALAGQQTVHVATNCAALWQPDRYREVAQLLFPGVVYPGSIPVQRLAPADPSVRRRRVAADAIMQAATRSLPEGARMIAAVGSIEAAQTVSLRVYSTSDQLAQAMQALAAWQQAWQPALVSAAASPSDVEPLMATLQEDLDAIQGECCACVRSCCKGVHGLAA